MLAAQRTSSLHRASRTWETSTTSVRALVECQNTSAPFVGTAPQVTLEVEDGGETWVDKLTLTINITTQITEGKIYKSEIYFKVSFKVYECTGLIFYLLIWAVKHKAQSSTD